MKDGMEGKDFVRGHALWLVTADAIADFYDLKLTARVNGQVWCEGNTGSTHWKVEEMIAHVPWGEKLIPGEVLGTGTVGWGSGAERDRFLRPGDTAELGVEGLGILRNTVGAP